MDMEIKDLEVIKEIPVCDLFLSLLYSQVDRGIYVWGGNGEILDNMEKPEEWIRRHEADRKDEERAIALYRKRIADGMTEIRAFDCSGLVYWALKELDLQKTDISSRGLYSACKKITKNELLPGDFVFHSQSGRVVHVGVFVGDGKYIEAKGRDYGVVCGTRKKSYWDKFGRFAKLKNDVEIDIGDLEPKPLTITIKGGSVNVRNKPTTIESAIIGIAHKGESYPVLGIDPVSKWYNISFKGKSGWITNKSEYVTVDK